LPATVSVPLMLRLRHRRRRLTCVAALALASASSPAAALDREATLLSREGDHSPNLELEGVSTDLRRVVVSSEEVLAPGAEDEFDWDLFLLSGGRTELITGRIREGAPKDADAEFAAISADGRTVAWSTEEDITPDDLEIGRACRDVFVTTGGRTSRVSTGPSQGEFCDDAHFGSASQDLRTIAFLTEEQLAPEDQGDTADTDVYVRSGGTTTLVAAAPGATSGPVVSADGSRVFFGSSAPMTALDADDEVDIFEWRRGKVRLVTAGPAGGNGPFGATLALALPPPFYFDDIPAITPDGRRAWFFTAEPLTADDRDARIDLYERGPAGTRRVSAGPAGGNGPFDVGEPEDWRRDWREGDPVPGQLMGVTPDGRRVFFTTMERLTRDDRDHHVDVYLRAGARTELVSNAGWGKTSSHGVWTRGISSDGRRAILQTRERLTRDDRDDSLDLFEWNRSGTRRLSGGPRGGNRDEPYVCSMIAGCRRATDVYTGPVSRDARRVFFTTQERLTRDDRNGGESTYEHVAGRTTLARLVGDGGRVLNAALDWRQSALTPDGRTLVVRTATPLARADRDEYNDIYLARMPSRRNRR
jgi:hypothetical protein